MSTQSQYEREEAYLEEQYANGEISLKEFNAEMRHLAEAYREAAREAAEAAYQDEIGGW